MGRGVSEEIKTFVCWSSDIFLCSCSDSQKLFFVSRLTSKLSSFSSLVKYLTISLAVVFNFVKQCNRQRHFKLKHLFKSYKCYYSGSVHWRSQTIKFHHFFISLPLLSKLNSFKNSNVFVLWYVYFPNQTILCTTM